MFAINKFIKILVSENHIQESVGLDANIFVFIGTGGFLICCAELIAICTCSGSVIVEG